jgi:hypothetical protein
MQLKNTNDVGGIGCEDGKSESRFSHKTYRVALEASFKGQIANLPGSSASSLSASSHKHIKQAV